MRQKTKSFAPSSSKWQAARSGSGVLWDSCGPTKPKPDMHVKWGALGESHALTS